CDQDMTNVPLKPVFIDCLPASFSSPFWAFIN
ncbi:MAG: hypothetical protein ACI84R_002833, partial [Candidatus Azotimanducaceae bacterium]